MIGRESSPYPENTFKKIQNYIFNFSDLLGQGNFSKVYKAHHQLTGQIVAIKIIELNSLKSKKLEQLLFSEIEILKKLNHPNVLRCLEVFTSNRNCYIITEICNDGDLESKVKAKRTLKQAEAEGFIHDIFKGLEYLSRHNVIHRDLKVANIFIQDGRAKIADFGFARLTHGKFKDINIGSPIYMSPEGLIQNIYGPKTDIWSFGMLIYELLHGTTPFSHCKSENQLKYNMSIPIGWSQLKPQLSNEIKEVILKCLEVDQHKRASIQELSKLAFFRGKEKDGIVLTESASKKVLNSKYRINTENAYVPRKAGREMSDYVGRSHQGEPHSALPASYKKAQRDIDIRKTTPHTPHQSMQPSHSGKDAILSARVTFKQCVNMLHYCRLLFKHLMLMNELSFGDSNQHSIFKRWLATILKRLMVEIDDKKVDYSGQNSVARQKKLEQVTSEYIKKYTRQLDLDLSKIKLEQSVVINYDKIYSYFMSIHQMLDQQIDKEASRNMIQLASSMVMICDSTKVLRRCYQQSDYSAVTKLKDVQEFLAKSKGSADYSSYVSMKKKLSIA